MRKFENSTSFGFLNHSFIDVLKIHKPFHQYLCLIAISILGVHTTEVAILFASSNVYSNIMICQYKIIINTSGENKPY